MTEGGDRSSIQRVPDAGGIQEINRGFVGGVPLDEAAVASDMAA